MKQNYSMQLDFWNSTEKPTSGGNASLRMYSHILTVSENRKGILDVDTVKGCTSGMGAYPNGGCYGECYAQKVAHRFNLDFAKSVSRKFLDREHVATIIRLMNFYRTSWYRVGTSGDPSHDWGNTLMVCRVLRHTGKIPVIVTKHWEVLSDSQMSELRKLGAVINTSTSGMDTAEEIKHRVEQFKRLCNAGLRSVCRVVTCDYGTSIWARECKEKQEFLLSLAPVIDNPFRVGKSHPRVLSGEILVTRKDECVGGRFVSLHLPSIHLGICKNCSDQCGVDYSTLSNNPTQQQLWIGV